MYFKFNIIYHLASKWPSRCVSSVCLSCLTNAFFLDGILIKHLFFAVGLRWHKHFIYILNEKNLVHIKLFIWNYWLEDIHYFWHGPVLSLSNFYLKLGLKGIDLNFLLETLIGNTHKLILHAVSMSLGQWIYATRLSGIIPFASHKNHMRQVIFF